MGFVKAALKLNVPSVCENSVYSDSFAVKL